MDMSYPQTWSWLLMISVIVLWFHFPDTVSLKVAPPLRTHQTLVTSFTLVLLVLLEPHVFLPSCRLHSHWVFKAICAQGKSSSTVASPCSVSVPFSLSPTLPVLLSQGPVLVLIKAVSFCLLPAVSRACCALRGNSDIEWRGMRRWLNPEVGGSRFWVTLPSSQSGKHAASLQRPDACNRVIIGRSMVPASLAIFLHYAQLAASTSAASSLLGHMVWRGPGRQSQSACWLGVNQGHSQ